MLRAEKGYVIVGQETDGTQTPDDLGMSWIVNTGKGDFVGKRSLVRSDLLREDRKQLVGLLTADPEHVLVEGTQLIDDAEIPPPAGAHARVGHVLVPERGARPEHRARARRAWSQPAMGDTIHAVVGRSTIPCQVADSVFYDQEGARRDG